MAANARKALPWIAATAAVALPAVLLTVFVAAPEPSAPAPRAEASAPAAPVPSASSAPSPAATASPAPGGGDAGSALAELLREREPEPGGPSAGPPELYPVDLEKLRAKLPDNLYWELAAPTKDVEVLKKRDADSRRWNDLYGKVLSGTATEAEIHQYYAHRRQVSEDFIAFATTVLADYAGQLPERDEGLYQLSIDMHRTRLAELPGQEAEALGRREAHEKRREAWRRGQPAP